MNNILQGAKMGAISFLLAAIIIFVLVYLLGNKDAWLSFVDTLKSGTFVLGGAFFMLGILLIIVGFLIK